MSDQGSNEIMMLSMIARHFRFILRIQELLKHNTGRNQIATQLGVRPFFVDNYITQARRIPEKLALNFYKKICDTDRDLKSFNWDKKKIAENLILSL